MYLKRLELSGFKSFAKATTLEFPSRITAIVGPNGSGKSNVKEGIQWVLGEQSMKSLRGKKGEDLIWNGSPTVPRGGPQVPRMGKGSVTLVFDNKDGKIPIEFEEVLISRKIFRDGMNEYFINNSQTRLKDVVELMARIGLGETKHNIIGQGEVDRILLASPRDRREVLEEALGLRVYQIKKHETERKLVSVENNMSQVEALVREIAPHLRFLKAQAKKAETRGNIEAELQELQKIYFSKEQQEIDSEKNALEGKKKPLVERQKEITDAMRDLTQKIGAAEKAFISSNTEQDEDKKWAEGEKRLREIERERGRLEGKLEVERERLSQPRLRQVDSRYIKEEIETFVNEVRSLLEEEENIETLRSHLLVMTEDLENLLAQIERGSAEEKRGSDEQVLVRELEETIGVLKKEAGIISEKLQVHENSRSREREDYRNAQIEIRGLDSLLRARQDEERDSALQLERIKFEEEQVKMRERIFDEEIEKMGFTREVLARVSLDEYGDTLSGELRKKIERMRGKLEEIGGIDPEVVKEYQETESRHTFLTNELEDLKKASLSLKELVKELDQHIKKDFREGFSKIKEEFHNYFRIIFGGGRASLQLVKLQQRGGEEDVIDTPIDVSAQMGSWLEEGVELSVDLPRKRIHGLAMLSGGERALTSIALLFAITAVNPPPFLVLDETDAALDEANSQRYSAILRELAKKTQLLLITHNRETMKCASVLYGVTMGDDGVSKLLSLQFDEAEAYTNR
jgi:chromosome segregation protein